MAGWQLIAGLLARQKRPQAVHRRPLLRGQSRHGSSRPRLRIAAQHDIGGHPQHAIDLLESCTTCRAARSYLGDRGACGDGALPSAWRPADTHDGFMTKGAISGWRRRLPKPCILCADNVQTGGSSQQSQDRKLVKPKQRSAPGLLNADQSLGQSAGRIQAKLSNPRALSGQPESCSAPTSSIRITREITRR